MQRFLGFLKHKEAGTPIANSSEENRLAQYFHYLRREIVLPLKMGELQLETEVRESDAENIYLSWR